MRNTRTSSLSLVQVNLFCGTTFSILLENPISIQGNHIHSTPSCTSASHHKRIILQSTTSQDTHPREAKRGYATFPWEMQMSVQLRGNFSGSLVHSSRMCIDFYQVKQEKFFAFFCDTVQQTKWLVAMSRRRLVSCIQLTFRWCSSCRRHRRTPPHPDSCAAPSNSG